MRVRTRTPGLLEACDDPALFGLDLWPRQRRLLRDVERGPRLHVWALGRRSGKTTMAAVVALWDCLFRPELDALVRPGERRYAVAVATRVQQARLFLNAAVTIVERSPVLADLVEGVTDDELRFTNGTAIAAFPCTSRGGRGWPISTLLLDEFAHMLDTEGNSAAESVWRSLVPSTVQFGKRARVIVASTPLGSDGAFASLYAQAESGELRDAKAHRASSPEVNPTLDRSLLKLEEQRDPEGFRSEYLAEFVGGGSAYLEPETINSAVARRGELQPDQGTAWIAGLDPAFSSDPFGLALVARDPADGRRLLLGKVQAWKPRRRVASFEERDAVRDSVLDEVAAVCRRYNARAVADQYLAAPIADYLRRAGVPVQTVTMTAQSKSAAFAELRAQLVAGALELYDDRELLQELRRLRSRYTAGQAAVVNPRVGGSHGDRAQALAIATYAHRQYGGGDTPIVGTIGVGIAELMGGQRPWDRSGQLDTAFGLLHPGMKL